MFRLRVISLLFVVSGLFTRCNNSQEFSQWRGPNRDGIYPEKNLLKRWPDTGPELLWKFEDLGMGYSSAVVTSDKIFTTGAVDSTGYIFAFNKSGKILWKKAYGKSWTGYYPGVRSTPVICGNHGYILSAYGKLICFSAEDGDIVWSRDMFNEFNAQEVIYGLCENLLIDGEKIYCTPGGKEANVIALNRRTGELIWESEALKEPSAYCSPIIIEFEGKRYLVTITAKSAIALDPDNGMLVWSHDLQYPHGIHGNVPVYRDGYLFAMNGWGYGSVMLRIIDNGNSVEEVWRSNLFDLEHGNVVLLGNNLYGTDYTTKNLSCVDWKTGVVKQSVKKYAPATLISADSMIYCYSYSGDLSLIKPTDKGFDIVCSFKTYGKKKDHLAHPVIADGRLYVRYVNSLYVYDIAKS